MATITRSSSSRGKPTPPMATQRLDIQGLRMVAVMLVVFSHLFGWPRGGFIGVDVFFVISGFLITGSLLHTFEKTGRISFSGFYRRRIRRIMPVATLVLVVTCITAWLVVSAARAKSTLLDAVWAFFFVSNWRFGLEGTDYFTASGPTSPLQHYWSLSVEEQFYFVWPAVVLAIGVVVTRMQWSRNARLATSAGVMGLVVAASFAYSAADTAANPTWAYFSTMTRVWELGVGALLAISISYFERIPDRLRPFIAWTGLTAIGVGSFTISADGGGFPAPWAAVPVLGAALIILAGVAGEQRYLQVLTNRGSTYIGDISYSLYLWHWPVIILLAVLMESDPYYYISALLLMFGLSVASYHFFENPIRQSNWLGTRAEKHDRSILDASRWRLRALRMNEQNQAIGIASLALVTAGLVAYVLQPMEPPTAPPARAQVAQSHTVSGAPDADLAAQISAAVNATEWPELNPSMDDAIQGKQAPEDVVPCGAVKRLPASSCTWGNPDAEKSIMLLGDSVAMTYVAPLRNFALNSNGQWNIRAEAMFGCRFVDITFRDDNAFSESCPGRKSDAITAVNEARPDVVIIANGYGNTDSAEWEAGITRLTSQFAANVGKIVFLAAPPNGKKPADCYNRASTPADCLSEVSDAWTERAAVEQRIAQSMGAVFLDSREWFCTSDNYCPSFVGTTPVKLDATHMTPEYADLMSTSFAARLRSAGIA